MILHLFMFCAVDLACNSRMLTVTNKAMSYFGSCNMSVIISSYCKQGQCQFDEAAALT